MRSRPIGSNPCPTTQWHCQKQTGSLCVCLYVCVFCIGDPDSKRCFTRAKRWIFNPGEHCAGRWIREVCNVAVGDLPWVIDSSKMFINKIRLDDSPTAFRCLELWYRDRVAAERQSRPLASQYTSSSSLADLGYRFNSSDYSLYTLDQRQPTSRTPKPNGSGSE